MGADQLWWGKQLPASHMHILPLLIWTIKVDMMHEVGIQNTELVHIGQLDEACAV